MRMVLMRAGYRPWGGGSVPSAMQCGIATIVNKHFR
jgi:hypothetical protein